jgi:hypothetical protein
MKRSLAKLSFNQYSSNETKPIPDRVKANFKWCTQTLGVSPNDCNICLFFTQDVQPDNTALVEISFNAGDADYMLQPGAKFKIYGGSIELDLTVNVLNTLDDLEVDMFSRNI